MKYIKSQKNPVLVKYKVSKKSSSWYSDICLMPLNKKTYRSKWDLNNKYLQ